MPGNGISFQIGKPNPNHMEGEFQYNEVTFAKFARFVHEQGVPDEDWFNLRRWTTTVGTIQVVFVSNKLGARIVLS